MELQTLKINQLRADPNQPRKSFNETRLKEMAQSMRGGGVITPIEVDGNDMIICGEMRWRAAQLAGLKEVPCVINKNKLFPLDRLLRQCIENAHHSDMTTMDTARAWKNLLSPGLSSGDKKPHTRNDLDVGYERLGKKLGKSANTVRDIVKLLDEPEWIKDELNRGNGIGYTLIRDANRAKNKGVATEIKRKILKGELKSQNDVNDAVRFTNKFPDKTKDILGSFTKEGVKRELEDITGELPRIKPRTEHPNMLANRADMYIFRLERDLDTIVNEILPQADQEHRNKVLQSLLFLQKKIGEIIKRVITKKLPAP